MRSATVAVSLVLSACATPAYQPLRVDLPQGWPADSYARCRDLSRGRYRVLVVEDAQAFRLQTDWVAGPNPDVASQQRVTLFREGTSVACVVEVRYLGFAMFASIPSWSAPRADVRLEEELGDALRRALGA